MARINLVAGVAAQVDLHPYPLLVLVCNFILVGKLSILIRLAARIGCIKGTPHMAR